MNNDFLKELKFLGVTARLKRLNDRLSGSIKELYKAKNIDFEPSWHLVFLILMKKNRCSMTDIAKTCLLSQPAVTKMINRMVKKGYIIVTADKIDGRKKLISLTPKAKSKLPRLEEIWDAGQKSIGDILLSNKHFLNGLDKFEKEIDKKDFLDRALERLGKN